MKRPPCNRGVDENAGKRPELPRLHDQRAHGSTRLEFTHPRADWIIVIFLFGGKCSLKVAENDPAGAES